METVADFIFLGSKITADSDCNHEIKRCLLLGRKAMTNLDSLFKKKERHHFANKGLYSQSYGFSNTHVQMWELHHKEGWVTKNRCLQTVVLEETLESPLDCKEIQPVHPKGNQSWIFTGRTNAEVSILWPPDVKSWLTGKDPDAGKNWGQEEKGEAEDETVGWHHRLNGQESEQTLGESEGQGSLVCCSPWGHSQTWLRDWTTATCTLRNLLIDFILKWSTNSRASGPLEDFLLTAPFVTHPQR